MQKPQIKDNQKADIRKSYFPDEKELSVLKHVYSRYEYMKQGRSRYDEHWDKWEKQWEAWRPEKAASDWKSNIVPPLSTSIVETVMAEVQQHDIEPPIHARGEEDLWKVDIWKEAIKFSKQQGDFKLEEADVKKEAFIFGTGFGEELLWQNKREIRFAKTRWEKGKKIEYMDTSTIYDYNGLLFEHVPIRDLYFDEAAKTINNGRRQANDAIRKFIMTKESAYNFLSDPKWNQKNNLQYVETGKKADFFQFYEPPGRINADEEVEVLFYWCKTPDLLAIVANDVLVFEAPNPYNHKLLPFVQAFDIKRTNSLYHKGEMELLESIQEELNINRRSRIDRVHLTIDPMWLTSRRANITEDDLLARPHGSIEVDDINDAARELRPGDTPVSAYREEEALLRDAQRVTGVDDGSQSVDRGSSTATEFAGLREATLRKVALKLWHIHNGFHVSHARLRLANIMQFWTQEKYEKVVGPANFKEYEKLIEQYKADDNLYVQENEDYKAVGEKDNLEGKTLFRKTTPRIRVQDKKFVRGDNGIVHSEPFKGVTFFDPKPEDILPYYGGFDVEYEGSPNVPLTRALMQTKWSELIDRVLPVAMSGVGGYDPVRLIDKLIKVHDEDPDHFKVVEQQPEESSDLIELAYLENEQMMKGVRVPPTPNSIPSHSMIHTAYMKSKPFQQLRQAAQSGDPQAAQILDIFTEHVVGEDMAQQQRGGQLNIPDNMGQATQQPGQQPPMPTIDGMDGRISGGASVQQGLPPGGRTGSSPIGNMIRRFMGGGQN